VGRRASGPIRGLRWWGPWWWVGVWCVCGRDRAERIWIWIRADVTQRGSRGCLKVGWSVDWTGLVGSVLGPRTPGFPGLELGFPLGLGWTYRAGARVLFAFVCSVRSTDDSAGLASPSYFPRTLTTGWTGGYIHARDGRTVVSWSYARLPLLPLHLYELIPWISSLPTIPLATVIIDSPLTHGSVIL
jgi:hypothetical protein